MTLVGNPSVIFLDEPTTGLDPRSRRTMWQIIRELVTDGVTIFLTTQYLEEADHLADYVAVLDHGRIVAEGTPAELKHRIPGGRIQLQFAEPDALRATLSMIPNATLDGDQTVLRVPGDGSVASLRRVLDDAHITVERLSIHTPDLDDVFFAVTGHTATRHERKPSSHDVPRPHVRRFSDDASPQPQTPAALPVADADAGWPSGRVPAAVRLFLRSLRGSRSRSAGCPPRWGWRPRASKPPATPPCSSPCSPADPSACMRSPRSRGVSGIALASYLWAIRLYNHRRAAEPN